VATHNETGKKGESLAADWLEKSGFTLLHHNWRHSHYEIDIIASRSNMLHFIEVKTRRSNRFGYPEESVSDRKMENLMQAAEEFLYRYPEWKKVQYDVLSITMGKNEEADFFLIEDVYL
jgi:putative endonuclease